MASPQNIGQDLDAAASDGGAKDVFQGEGFEWSDIPNPISSVSAAYASGGLISGITAMATLPITMPLAGVSYLTGAASSLQDTGTSTVNAVAAATTAVYDAASAPVYQAADAAKDAAGAIADEVSKALAAVEETAGTLGKIAAISAAAGAGYLALRWLKVIK